MWWERSAVSMHALRDVARIPEARDSGKRRSKAEAAAQGGSTQPPRQGTTGGAGGAGGQYLQLKSSCSRL
jgi:hypothetical protein